MKCPKCSKETDTLAYNDIIQPLCVECFHGMQNKLIMWAVTIISVLALIVLWIKG